jgi:hypothetical protein
MGRRKPQQRRAQDVLELAQRACRDHTWVARAISAELVRTDAGRVVTPGTWIVTVQFEGVDGPAIVLVDDQTGEVRSDDRW